MEFKNCIIVVYIFTWKNWRAIKFDFKVENLINE